MNTVSKYIYFSEVLGNLQLGLCVLLIPAAIATAILLITLFSATLGEAGNNIIKVVRRWSIVSSLILIITSAIAVFVPSQRTMLMIAASEATGIIVSSPEARTTMDKLLNKIDKKLSEDK